MSDDFRRLSYLKSNRKSRIISEKKVYELKGFEKISRYVYTRKTEVLKEFSYNKKQKLIITNKEYSLDDIIFFDTETTGLSSGAGNYIFLLGIINTYQNKIICEQVFLSDFPGEKDFIEYIADILPREKLYVSFNGKGFDYHALKNRFIINNKKITIEKQLDLLFIARRLWKRMIGPCSLGNIEEKVLCIKRINDIPGYEIPEAYFEFLRTGETEKIHKIIEHNLSDVVSLIRLLFHIERLIVNDSDTKVDHFGLGIYLLKYGKEDSVKHILSAYNKGDIKAGIYLGNYHKRNNDWEKALRIWNELKKKKNEYAFIELAKYYEHRKKDPESALKLMNELVELRKRKNILLRKNTMDYKISKESEIDKRIIRLKNKVKNMPVI